ncbi:MAG: cytidine deaminase [Deltaproteobacteria bacterium]|nr:cytidine deaminase [Deltaproteobacteria bacterium]
MPKISDQQLLNLAKKARKNAAAKHTGFAVGAAILSKSGKAYTGVNVESDIPSLSQCADRAALINALGAGEREFKALAIVTETKKCFPCGACRQLLAEFCGFDLKVISANAQGTHHEILKLADLLPHPYVMER